MNERATATEDSPQGAATRAALIDAARAWFARSGFDGASVRAITSDAGANLGSVTYHFGSKRELYEAVLASGLRPLADRVIAAADSDGTGLERLLTVVEVYFDHLAAHPDVPHLLLQEIAAGKEPPDAVREIMGEVLGALRELQREGERDGSIRPGDETLTALSVVAQPIYLTLVAPLLGSVTGIDVMQPSTHRTMIDHATGFVRRALEPRAEESP